MKEPPLEEVVEVDSVEVEEVCHLYILEMDRWRRDWISPSIPSIPMKNFEKTHFNDQAVEVLPEAVVIRFIID